MLAALSLGADGVQISSRFAVSNESSAHINLKIKLLKLRVILNYECYTSKLIKNEFYNNIEECIIQIIYTRIKNI